MDEKPFSVSFTPLLENTPPIDTRFVYDNFKEFKKYSILHHDGCISYIKDSDTFIQVMKDGYCKVLTYRVGIMDTSDFIKSIGNDVPHSLGDDDTKYFINYFLQEQNKNRLPSIAFEKTEFDRWDSSKEKSDFVNYNKYMHDYDILLDFTNNIFLYKVAKNTVIKNGDNDKYNISDIIIKIGMLDRSVENISDKIYSVSNEAISNINNCDNVSDLKNSLTTIFANLRNGIKQPQSSNNKKYQQFKDETIINTTSSESSSNSSSSTEIPSFSHEDHL
jgi:hypothetical protein|nr:MAG TPA: hypothetical protein [Caudoviricetes sp.]